jgi:hypothetical protein
MQIEPYQPINKTEWDSFISSSKNGTFLFERDYMDYHADRFTDCSLIVRNRSKIIAVVPANMEGDVIYSHQGLTYGGVIIGPKMTTPLFMEVFDEIVEAVKALGASSLVYKTVPSIYHKLPAEEDRYAFFLRNANLIRRDVLSVIRTSSTAPVQKRRMRGTRQAKEAHLSVGESDKWSDFWQILEGRLVSRYAAIPVHSLDEINLLHTQFPENIRLFVTSRGSEVLAGCVVYLTDRVAHAQYIAASDEGLSSGALDALFHQLITVHFRDTEYFDFGISNEKMGRYLNSGLVEYKEGFGARTVVHDHYELDIT